MASECASTTTSRSLRYDPDPFCQAHNAYKPVSNRCLVCADPERFRAGRCGACYRWHMRHRFVAKTLLEAMLAVAVVEVSKLRIRAELEPCPALARMDARVTRLSRGGRNLGYS